MAMRLAYTVPFRGFLSACPSRYAQRLARGRLSRTQEGGTEGQPYLPLGRCGQQVLESPMCPGGGRWLLIQFP
jgi:hypothetical protein